MKKSNAIIASVAAVGLTLAVPNVSFAATAGPSGPVMQTHTLASVIAMGQKVRNNEVTITYAYLPEDGFIAIYAGGSRGKMGNQPLGTLALTAGPHRNFTVKLNAPVTPGEKLWATLNAGTFKAGYANGKSEFRPWGQPVQQSFKVS